MPSIKLIGLEKRYEVGRHRVGAVDGITLDAPEGRILTLLGPSGCGKSTTLRCIAGLERPDDGEILFDARVVFSRRQRVFIPPERRNIGMVFQSYGIWPHLTVFENVAYPLQVRRLPARQIRERVMHALSLVGLSGLAGRPAPFLRGGPPQRGGRGRGGGWAGRRGSMSGRGPASPATSWEASAICPVGSPAGMAPASPLTRRRGRCRVGPRRTSDRARRCWQASGRSTSARI